MPSIKLDVICIDFHYTGNHEPVARIDFDEDGNKSRRKKIIDLALQHGVIITDGLSYPGKCWITLDMEHFDKFENLVYCFP